MDIQNNILCVANSYIQKYYLNPNFDILPKEIKNELKKICISYTENCGGIIILEFNEQNKLLIKTMVDDHDFYYDEIESKLCIARLQDKNEDLFKNLELLYTTLKIENR